ncbi:MAG TPA: glycosyltransferase N-terminal domain-containing protein [Parasegetibacter sp.]
MSLLIYNIFIWLYRLGIKIVALRSIKARLWIKGRQGIFEQIAAEMAAGGQSGESLVPTKGVQNTSAGQKSGPIVWVHCASLGEFEQGRPVIEALRQHCPALRIVLTFFSPSGYEACRNYQGADHIFYLPIDNARNAKKFLSLVKPDLVIFVKYEFWYYYLQEIHNRKIPLLLISAIFRPRQIFFRWYGKLHQSMLFCFSHIFVQNEESKQRLARIGYTEVTVSGDTRFDRVSAIAEKFEALPVIEHFCGKDRVIVAGSTWTEDEEELAHYVKAHPQHKVIIAPHEVDEDNIKDIETLFPGSIRYSVLAKNLNAPEHDRNSSIPVWTPGTNDDESKKEQGNPLIIDNIGMLSRLYKYATVAYVGGGFGNDGIHNILEAAVYNKPVIIGPVYEKFKEAVDLVEKGGVIVIESALELEARLNELLNNDEYLEKTGDICGNYVRSNTGATKDVLNYIQEKRLLTC